MLLTNVESEHILTRLENPDFSILPKLYFLEDNDYFRHIMSFSISYWDLIKFPLNGGPKRGWRHGDFMTFPLLWNLIIPYETVLVPSFPDFINNFTISNRNVFLLCTFELCLWSSLFYHYVGQVHHITHQHTTEHGWHVDTKHFFNVLLSHSSSHWLTTYTNHPQVSTKCLTCLTTDKVMS